MSFHYKTNCPFSGVVILSVTPEASVSALLGNMLGQKFKGLLQNYVLQDRWNESYNLRVFSRLHFSG